MTLAKVLERVAQTNSKGVTEFLEEYLSESEIEQSVKDQLHEIAIRYAVETDMEQSLEGVTDLSDPGWTPDPPRAPDDGKLNLVRRYMDLSSFQSLIESGLWFSRVDNYSDSFEGKYPGEILRRRWRTYEYNEMEGDPQVPYNGYDYRKARDEIIRKQSFTSCWRWGGHESAVFWDAYVQNEGLAIETTFDNLQKVLKNSGFEFVVGKVEYLDYQTKTFPVNPIAQVFHKRNGFTDERELRALIRKEADEVSFDVETSGSIEVDVTNSPGIRIPIDPNSLIDRVILAPGTSQWVVDLISDMRDTYDLEIFVDRSRLDAKPDKTRPKKVADGVREIIEDGMQLYRIEEHSPEQYDLTDCDQFVLLAVWLNSESYLREVHNKVTELPYSTFESSPDYGDGWNAEREKVQSHLKSLRRKELITNDGPIWSITEKGEQVVKHPYIDS